ncbi:phosphoenolpyruvate--protein phosphotransferase [Anaerobranca californiensis DSM 14826]|jgi:phosphotransferase system enzyme I (PtsI)|uniref:Phosphoenolpyruvate-protein phosphotransferase n=1 Tax=Anaerobranca californiensis DSM 14826 TaxID=1120989 RepID=A0A1M6NYL8_9FIRM|nr:phosphoenolpyruvate--protein phosphotransferase [Anaerobranca californiensis]SHK00740.1 phosphoenolpyruvate--protein phosphotransferase [Anaerobranca californiensis DSM 14826]
MLYGIGASKGIAMAPVLLLKEEELVIPEKSVEDLEGEIQRFKEAIEKSKTQLEKVKDLAEQKMGKDKAEIFAAHLLVLADPELINNVENGIKSEKKNAEFILDKTVKTFVQIFESMDNEYMKERAADIKDVGTRVLKNLMGIEMVNISKLDNEVIIVAHDLAPSDTAQMDKEKVLGFVTDIGGRTSHTAIMARSLEIPAVVGLGDITLKVKNGDYLIIDGDKGHVLINPDEETIEKYRQEKQRYEEYRARLLQLKDLPTKTKDGKQVELAANIGTPKDLAGVIKNGGEGIGLYRTEFLYMDRTSLPTEEEQFEAYKTVLEGMEGKPVVIRTLDIGGDKEIPYLNLPKEMNPFLGYRALRICLDKKEIFKTQLRALLRASVYGNLKIMYPMVSALEEVRQANEVLEEVKRELDNEGIPYSKNFEVGIMIEIPTAALISDILAKEVDFFSIGTNDLIQYSTAVDRMNQTIAHLYSPYHPGVLRMIKMVIDNGHKEGIWVGMCGEAAGELPLIPLFLGMGLDEFSMSATSILPARELISKLTLDQVKEIAEKALSLSTAAEIEQYLKSIVE